MLCSGRFFHTSVIINMWLANIIITLATIEGTHKAGQTEFAVYRHRPHGFSDFLKIFQISYSIQ